MSVLDLPRFADPDFIDIGANPRGPVSLNINNPITDGVTQVFFPRSGAPEEIIRGTGWTNYSPYVAEGSHQGMALGGGGNRQQSTIDFDVSSAFSSIGVGINFSPSGFGVITARSGFWMGMSGNGLVVGNQVVNPFLRALLSGEEFVVGARFDGGAGNLEGFDEQGNTTSIAAPTGASGIIDVGAWSAGGNNFQGNISLVIYWDRYLSDLEMTSMLLDPRQIFSPDIQIQYLVGDVDTPVIDKYIEAPFIPPIVDFVFRVPKPAHDIDAEVTIYALKVKK